jgi:hypothetical protein
LGNADGDSHLRLECGFSILTSNQISLVPHCKHGHSCSYRCSLQLTVYRFTCEVYSFTCAVYSFACAVYRFTCEVYSFTCAVFSLTCEVYSFTCAVYSFTYEVFSFTCAVYNAKNKSCHSQPNCLKIAVKFHVLFDGGSYHSTYNLDSISRLIAPVCSVAGNAAGDKCTIFINVHLT